MKRLNKSIVAASILTAFTMSNANATGWPVSDVGLLAYLSNSAAGGVVTDNGGVISLLKQVESDLSQITAQNTSLAKSNNDAQNQRGKWALGDNAKLSRMPDANACYAVTGSGSNGAASSSTGAFQTGSQLTAKNDVVNAVSTGPQSKNSRYERVASGFCSDDDAKYNRGGCTGAGQYPNADIDAGGLDGAPLTSGDIASNQPRKQDYSSEEAEKAKSLVKNATSNLPVQPITNKNYSNSVNGLYFSTNLASYQAKSLLAQKADNDIIAYKTEIPESKLTSEQLTSWNDNKSNWFKWFGTNDPKPTEWNLILAQVYGRYANEKWQTLLSTMTADESSRETNRQLAVLTKLETDKMKIQMTTNQLLAALLGNSIQPVTNEKLEAMKANALQSPTSQN
ncbi:hypothetical protein E1N66_19390 [Pantoea allii]|nr:hypothetical protein [Pantoea allii]THB82736.1 hypothetical protein E1N66_19390 [Pantoea allii]